jgi:hypothetical protein
MKKFEPEVIEVEARFELTTVIVGNSAIISSPENWVFCGLYEKISPNLFFMEKGEDSCCLYQLGANTDGAAWYVDRTGSYKKPEMIAKVLTYCQHQPHMCMTRKFWDYMYSNFITTDRPEDYEGFRLPERWETLEGESKLHEYAPNNVKWMVINTNGTYRVTTTTGRIPLRPLMTDPKEVTFFLLNVLNFGACSPRRFRKSTEIERSLDCVPISEGQDTTLFFKYVKKTDEGWFVPSTDEIEAYKEGKSNYKRKIWETVCKEGREGKGTFRFVEFLPKEFDESVFFPTGSMFNKDDDILCPDLKVYIKVFCKTAKDSWWEYKASHYVKVEDIDFDEWTIIPAFNIP